MNSNFQMTGISITPIGIAIAFGVVIVLAAFVMYLGLQKKSQVS